MSHAFTMIQTSGPLRDLVGRLAGEPCVALDTEFVWERTFYARLGLVQLGLEDGSCFLIDTVAVTDLSPLGESLANPGLVKILHDAPQDLMILRRATGAPARNVFDTRLAAGFAGLTCETSLQRLLADLLDVQLPKGHTRADWMARPLSAEQLDYAVDDVLYLPRVAALLRDRAREAGVEAWLDEELGSIHEDALYDERAPEEAYLRIRAAPFLPPRQQAVLAELAAWREREARAADRPRKHVADDPELVAVAKGLPRQEVDFPKCRELEVRTAHRYGGHLLAAVERGLARPETDLPALQPGPDERHVGRERVASVGEAIRLAAEAFRIDPRVVSTKSDILLLLAEGATARPENHRLLSGWRARLLGDSLNSILHTG